MKSSDHSTKLRLLSAFVLGSALFISGCSLFTSNEDRFREAVSHRNQGDLKAAAIEFKNVLKADPNHAQARWLLGKTYLDLNDGLSAKKELLRAQELGVDDDQLPLAIAKAYLLTSEPEAALKLIEETPGLAKDAQGLVVRGEAQMAQGRLEEAKQSFQTALDVDPEHVAASYGLIRMALNAKDIPTAQAQIEAVLKQDPDDFQGLVFKAELALSQGKPQLAIDAYLQALKVREFLLVRVGLARAYLASGNTEAAESQLGHVFEKSPDYLPALFLKAVSAVQRKDFDQAKSLLQEVLSKAPDHYASMFLLGSVHFNLGEYEQAANQLVSYLAEDVTNVNAKKLLAQAYLKLGDTQRAVERLESAADSAPNDPELMSMLGNLYTGMGDYAAGEDYFQRALKLAPGAK
ncbi:MAG: tetratricopeptide repeat protein, partial [Candidatus Thiodiazotropha sp.]